MKTFLNFKTFVTPKIIHVLYWISIVSIVLTGLVMMFAGSFFNPYGGGFSFSSFIGGLLFIVISILSLRIGFEVVLVLFRINENLESLRADKKE